eukprot:scaffold13227_cov117-Isochrysis_galbana.AAC.6
MFRMRSRAMSSLGAAVRVAFLCVTPSAGEIRLGCQGHLDSLSTHPPCVYDRLAPTRASPVDF